MSHFNSELSPQSSPNKISRSRKLFTKFLVAVSLFTIFAVTSITTPAQAANQNGYASFWGVSQYIWSFFGAADNTGLPRSRPTAAPEGAPAGSQAGNAPMAPLAPPCPSTGVTINVLAGGSIQSAINAANPAGGDTIQVAAGTYTEQLTVNKCVTIDGAGQGTTIIKSPATLAASLVPGITNTASIVEIRSTKYVTMTDLTVTGPVPFTNDVYGVYVVESSTLKMDRVRVTAIHQAAGINGVQNGNAVRAGSVSFNQIGELDFDNVTIDDYQKTGIIVSRGGSSAAIDASTLTGAGAQTDIAQNGIQINDGATATINNNTISGNVCDNPACSFTTYYSYGILALETGAIRISGNTFNNNDAGVYSLTPGFVSTIDGNTLTQTRYSGLDLDQGTNNVTNNFIIGSAFGPLTGVGVLSYTGDTGNTVADLRSNSITGASQAGIELDDFGSGDGFFPTLTASFNRIAGNAIGINNTTTTSPVSQTNNFWGCNLGPNGGAGVCDTTAGGVNVSTPYLILSNTTTSTPSVNAAGTATIGTNLRFNNLGANTFTATDHLPNPIPSTPTSANNPGGIPVSFSVPAFGSVSPATAPLINGLASTTFTGGTVDGGDKTAVVTAKVDNATNSVNVTVLDSIAPTVQSATGSLFSPSVVNYTVTFSEAVTGVDTSDFTVVTTSGNAVASVTGVSGSGNTRTVQVTLTSGMGTIRLDVIDNDSIVDTASALNRLNGVGASPNFMGTPFAVDVQMPTVTINQATGQADPTSSSPINFTVVFSEPVTGFATGDVSFTGSTAGGTLVGTVTQIAPNDFTTYNVAVSGMTTSGTVIASIPANVAVDSTNNGNAASASTDNSVTYLQAVVTNTNTGETFGTIQAGIDDSDTINGHTLVASAGVYNERVAVNKQLNIRGAQAGNLAKSRTNLNAESIIVVDNSGTSSFNLQVDNVTINGFDFDVNRTFPTASDTASNDKPGSLIVGNGNPGGDGYQNINVLNNRMIYREANVDTPSNPNRGAVFFFFANNLTIEGNYFAGFPGQAIILANGSTNLVYRNNDSFNNTSSNLGTQGNFGGPTISLDHTNALIENNRHDQDSMILFLLKNSVIRNNTLTAGALGSSRVYLGGGANNISVEGNTFALTNAVGLISFDPGFGYGPNSNINFTGNTLTRNSLATPTGSITAIDYRGTGGTNTIANNTLTLTGTLPANSSTYGIRIRGSASGNFNVVGNNFDGNNVIANGTAQPLVSGLYITSNEPTAGVTAGDSGAFPTTSVVNVNCNRFTEFQNGVVVFNAAAGAIGGLTNGDNVNINFNNLIANTSFGINNGGTSATIDGENNYWNSPNGPSGAGSGTGDAVSTNVDFDPFLTAPSMCAPVNTVPGTQSVNQDTTLTFTGANQISVADLDVGSSPVTITLSVTNGTLSLSSTTGLTFTTGDGTSDATMTFSGTLANVNAALNGLIFTPTAGFVGTSTLTLTSSSTGSPGVGGGTQTDTDTVTINVLDAIAPTVTINQVPPPAQTDPTSTSPINFTAVFSESVANFATGDVTVTGSAFGPGSTPLATVTGSGTTYNVAVSGMMRSGTVMVTIGAGVASDAQGNANAASTSTDNSVFFNFVVVAPVVTTQSVNPTNITTQQFAFVNEGATGSGAFVTGPATPPSGVGSAQLTIDGTGRQNLATARFGGTRLADISSLQYSAYTNRSDGLTITLQFDADYDLSDANNAFQNRLVYEPAAQAIPVAPNTWQTFDTLAGRFYSSNANNPGGLAGCTQATPCTKQQLLAFFPNVGIRGGAGATAQGGLYLRAGGPFPGGMVANADSLIVGVNGNTTTFDFEPTPPTISISAATAVTEGNTGQTTATFTITQSVVSQLNTTVTVNTANGTATTADNDYQPIVNQTFTIPAGQTTATANVVVNINGDTNVEGNETFTVNLSNALNAAILDGSGTGTINNDDVVVSFSSPTYMVGEAGGTATINVTRNGVTPNTVTVDYATSSGSAVGGTGCTAGVDFVNATGTLTFAGGDTSMSFAVTVCNDTLSETPETVGLMLSNVTGGATLGLAGATLTITDNDGGGPVSISGVITQDSPTGAGLNGVRVDLTGTNVPANTFTTTMTINGVPGSYSFTGLTGNATSPNNYLVTPSLAGRVFDPTERSYVNLGMNVTNANFVAFNTGAVPRNLRIVNTSQSTIGSTVTIPIVLDSLGTENALSFSLNYNPSFLSNPTVACGSDAPDCLVSFNNIGGTLGIEFTRANTPPTAMNPNGTPTAFTAGTGRQVVTVTFTATPVTMPMSSATFSTPITFGDVPTARDVNDVEGNSVPTNYINGSVIFAQGIEGDVAPRPNGNGGLTGNDVTVLRQFVNGSLTPDPATNEFARADVAPAGGKGNGSLTSADVTVLRGYVQNSIVTPVGGPNQPTTGARTAFSILDKEAGVGRNIAAAAGDIRIVTVNAAAGATNISVPIELDSGGNENGVTVSVQFDTSKLTFVSATAGADVASQSGTTFDVNTTQLAAGRVGVALTLDINRTFMAGPKRVIVLTFNVAANATSSAITFVNNPLNSEINNTTGDTLPASFIAGNVNIGGPTAAVTTIRGRVVNAAGRSAVGATVTLTDALGNSRTTRTNPRGLYRFDGVTPAATYVVNATYRSFSGSPQVVSVTGDSVELDIVLQ